MFCAICVCGPAAGPNGVSNGWPKALVLNGSSLRGTKKCCRGIPRIEPLVSSSPKTHSINCDDEIGKNSSGVYEACSFQDITSQHISQVLKSITYVEERVNSLIDFWGHDKLISTKVAAEERTEDKKLLNGPQLEGQGLSQDDIDLQFD